MRKVVLPLAREKSRSLESANEAKTGEQSIFSKIHTNHAFGMPYNTALWTRKQCSTDTHTE